MGIIIPIIIVIIACLIIWKTGDSFEVASQFLGRNLSDGVRGASINAIASSMPELLTSLFFLINIKDAVGFSGGVGTTAGSAIFNSMVIPAFVGIIVFFKLSSRKFQLSRKVIIRDGIFLLLIELLLIFMLSNTHISWVDGLMLIGAYVLYLVFMFTTMKGKIFTQRSPEEEEELSASPLEKQQSANKLKLLLKLELAELVIGKSKINNKNSWQLLILSTFVMGISCLMLVQACEFLGAETYYLPFVGELNGLGIPIMFVALILVSAASSVPDAIISVKDAQKGNYDDAFSNVLGSNIFDICFALGFPIFVYTLVYGPFIIPADIMEITVELRIILIVLTAFAVLTFVIGKDFTPKKALMLITMYGIFVFYVVYRGVDHSAIASLF